MIYAMQNPNGGPVKIGSSRNVENRRLQLEAYFGTELIVLATYPGGRAAEMAMHDRFNEERIGRTEQFRPSVRLMTFLGHPKRGRQRLGKLKAMKPVDGRKRVILRVKELDHQKLYLASRYHDQHLTDYAVGLLLRHARPDWMAEIERHCGLPVGDDYNFDYVI